MTADNTAGSGNSLPAALGKREIMVTLLDGAGTVTVTRWSWSKSVKIFKHMSEILSTVSDEQAAKMKGRGYEVAAGMMGIMGDRVVEILKAGVSPEEAAKFSDDSPAEDIVAITDAMIQINMTEGMTKKVLGLWKRFAQKLMASPKITDSKPLSESFAPPVSQP